MYLIRTLFCLCLTVVCSLPAMAAPLVNAKDLFYRELKSPTNASTGLAYCIELRRKGQRPILCNNRYPFQTGDAIKLHIKSNRTGYAYIVMAQGSTGKKAVLYPPQGSTEDNLLEAGKEYVVPPNGVIEFDNNAGTEKVLLVLSPQQVSLDAALASARNINITQDHLTGIPEQVDNCSVYSNEGVYENTPDSSRPLKPGQGQVYVVNPDSDAVTAVGIVLSHLGGQQASCIPFTQPGSVATAPALVAQPSAQSTPAPNGPNRPISDKWAFVVGCDRFLNGNGLRFCVKDAISMREFLINEAGFSPNHVLMLTNEQATTANVMRVMTELLPQAVRKDDLVVLYFSTHGSGNLTGPNYNNHIVTYDTGPEVPGVHMQTLGDLIKAKIPSDRVVTILDVCFAGSAKDLDAKDYLDSLLQGSGEIIVSACGPNETSQELPQYGHGLFTYHLLNSLREKKALKASFDETRQKVIVDEPGQHPIINYERWQGNDVVLFSRPKSPRP